MKTDLNSGGYLNAHALTQPYSGTPWTYTGSCDASVPAGFFTAHPNVVDWVYVQVCSSDAPTPGSIVDAKAALILNDGQIVSHTDGASALTFPSLPDGAYYIAVFHRNSLSVMTDAAQVFASGFAGYDFTDGSAYGTSAQLDLGGGVFGLWGGDGDNNDSVGDRV